MQHKQQNYKTWFCSAWLIAAGVAVAQPADSAGIAQPGKPDPILMGGSAGPCDPQLDGADYVPGTDVNGNPVAAADLPGQTVPVPDHLDIPLKNASGGMPAYVTADGKSLAPLLNPPAACTPRH
jgi:hypothetical protein